MKKTTPRTPPPPPAGLPIPYPQTPESVRAYMAEHGICLADVARYYRISRYALFDALRMRGPRSKGLRGGAHRAAVLLGLKPAPANQGRRAA